MISLLDQAPNALQRGLRFLELSLALPYLPGSPIAPRQGATLEVCSVTRSALAEPNGAIDKGSSLIPSEEYLKVGGTGFNTAS